MFMLKYSHKGKKMEKDYNLVLDGIMGVAIGDALGLPVQFLSRKEIAISPITKMIGFGTFNVPAGYFSDDTSLTLCLLDSLIRYRKINYANIMDNFVMWLGKGKFTPGGFSYDVGNSTLIAIRNYAKGIEPTKCGPSDEFSNGNGSLMRILPLSFFLYEKNGADFFSNPDCITAIDNVCSLTHGTIRTKIAAGIYLSIATKIIEKRSLKTKGLTKRELAKAIESGSTLATDYYLRNPKYLTQVRYYQKLMVNPKNRHLNIFAYKEAEIKSSGYVVDTIEAAVWCLLMSNSYRSCVLMAVNLGDDTDTVAAVAGGLAGLAYGYEKIPKQWLSKLAKRIMIEKMCDQYNRKLSFFKNGSKKPFNYLDIDK